MSQNVQLITGIFSICSLSAPTRTWFASWDTFVCAFVVSLGFFCVSPILENSFFRWINWQIKIASHFFAQPKPFFFRIEFIRSMILNVFDRQWNRFCVCISIARPLNSPCFLHSVASNGWIASTFLWHTLVNISDFYDTPGYCKGKQFVWFSRLFHFDCQIG